MEWPHIKHVTFRVKAHENGPVFSRAAWRNVELEQAQQCQMPAFGKHETVHQAPLGFCQVSPWEHWRAALELGMEGKLDFKTVCYLSPVEQWVSEQTLKGLCNKFGRLHFTLVASCLLPDGRKYYSIEHNSLGSTEFKFWVTFKDHGKKLLYKFHCDYKEKRLCD